MAFAIKLAGHCRVVAVLSLVRSVFQCEGRTAPGPSTRARLRQTDVHQYVGHKPGERVTWDDILHRHIPHGDSEPHPFNTTRWHGSLHDVVGEDGVVLIHVDDEEIAMRNGEGLVPVGVVATPFAATDARVASPDELSEGCVLGGDAGVETLCPSRPDGGHASGCVNRVEQAIADSHRRALEFALGRASDWTAIFEDDALPVTGGIASEWNNAFARVWPHVPEEAKMVRLGWCTFEEDVGPVTQHVLFDGGDFKILSALSIGDGEYYAGGCTTAYLVHRSIIPRLLDVFPCCSPIDSCLEEKFFYQPAGCRASMTCDGGANMVSIDAMGSTEFAAGRTFLQGQSGILVQDNPMFMSHRVGSNSSS